MGQCTFKDHRDAFKLLYSGQLLKRITLADSRFNDPTSQTTLHASQPPPIGQLSKQAAQSNASDIGSTTLLVSAAQQAIGPFF
jgi:hypothetical protein